jgi:hypothetical protein
MSVLLSIPVFLRFGNPAEVNAAAALAPDRNIGVLKICSAKSFLFTVRTGEVVPGQWDGKIYVVAALDVGAKSVVLSLAQLYYL